MKWTDIEGWFEPIQGDMLQVFCKNKIYLEVGSYKGRSTACAAEVAKEVFAVDTFKATNNGQDQKEDLTTLDEFLINTSGYDNIKYHIGESKAVSKKFKDESIDIVFIDGLHDYASVIEDKESWWGKLNIGGYMLFHDYGDACQVKLAVDYMFPEASNKFCLAWVRKKNRLEQNV